MQMKKLWIGTGITILLIIIGNITAQKLVPDRAVPISVFAACLCLLIPTLLTTVLFSIAIFEDIKERNPKGKKDIGVLIAPIIYELLLFATLTWVGIRGVNAAKDIINDPIEQPVYFAYINKTRTYGYRTRGTSYYLRCRTDDGKSERLKIRVNKSKLDDVRAVIGEAESEYGFFDAKYIVIYYENLKILKELQMVTPPVDTGNNKEN